MASQRKAERKPLSFSTTMRNPMRIAGFLHCILPHEGEILTENLITDVIIRVLQAKIYHTNYEMGRADFRAIYKDESITFTREQAITIIENSPQEHKEADFTEGWASRFDTWYKLPKEFGFISYAMNKPIHISQTGHMLIDALNEQPINSLKVQNVMLNSMMKYQSDNPFRRNLNSNVPLLLLLNVLRLLKNDSEENGAGLCLKELPLFICWQDNDANKLYELIKKIRKEHGFHYSDEYIYTMCLNLLEVDISKANRFKMSQICGEAVDEYIRKMRSTGIISLRGNGRFIDFNTLEQEKIDYIIDNYSIYDTFEDAEEYYQYMGTIDNTILGIKQNVHIDISDIRKKTIYKYAKEYPIEKVFHELTNVCFKHNSDDPMLKLIDGPVRLEFLTSIALAQNFEGLDVNPNYAIDDEGLPTFTASGGRADIECYDIDYDSYFEVTLMCGRSDQVNNEIIPISRHLRDAIKAKRKESFSVFVAPTVHDDTRESAEWQKMKYGVDILTFDIREFISNLQTYERASQLLTG